MPSINDKMFGSLGKVGSLNDRMFSYYGSKTSFVESGPISNPISTLSGVTTGLFSPTLVFPAGSLISYSVYTNT